MKTLIYIYAVIYVVFAALTIASAIKEKAPWWDLASDAILLPLGAIGILLYLFQVDYPLLKFVWKVVSVLIVAGQLFSNLHSRRLTLTGKGDLDPKKISQSAILAADLTAVVFLAPMCALNILFAFS